MGWWRMTDKPEKKKGYRKHDFELGSPAHSDHCHCKGYNQACDEWNTYHEAKLEEQRKSLELDEGEISKEIFNFIDSNNLNFKPTGSYCEPNGFMIVDELAKAIVKLQEKK